MGRPRGIIRLIADEIGLDQATARRSLATAGITEAQAEADFAKAVETVKAIADTDRVIGHAANGRGEGGSNGSTYAEARAKSELHRARKLELQNAKLEGSLLDREAYTETGKRIIAEARTALLSIGYRVASKIAGKTSEREIASIVEAEVTAVLGALSNPDKFFEQIEVDALS